MQSFYSVSPDTYSEKNLMESFREMLSDCLPVGVPVHDSSEELVIWVEFERYPSSVVAHDKISFLVLMGTNHGLYIWSLLHNGVASLLYSRMGPCVIASKLICDPHPDYADYYKETRPLIASCCEQGNYQWEVQFASIATASVELCYTSPSFVSSIDANQRFIIICRIDCISVLSAHTLLELFTLGNVKSTHKSVMSKCLPVAFGNRWLAYPDVKPVYHHMSRCGDASKDSSQPVATTVLNVKERIWDSLTAFASSVSGGSQSPSPHPGYPVMKTRSGISPDSYDKGLPSIAPIGNSEPSTSSSSGFVTIVDLIRLSEAYAELENHALLESPATKEHSQPSNIQRTTAVGQHDPRFLTRCPHAFHPPPKQQQQAESQRFLSSKSAWLDAHEYADNGCMVAHFMAHRWASVGYLEFDATGSLLFSACVQGHSFHVFRVSSHPQDSSQSALHHLYILNRGSTPCEIVDACFSYDSRWLAVSSNHGTTHVFPITPYGGPITVRTHIHSKVVNRTSRYHRSSGLEEHQLTRPQPSRSLETVTSIGQQQPCVASTPTSSGISIGGVSGQSCFEGNRRFQTGAGAFPPGCKGLKDSNSDHLLTSPILTASDMPQDDRLITSTTSDNPMQCFCQPNKIYNTTNARMPPYPEPCQIQPEARLRPRLPSHATGSGYAVAAINAATGALEAVSGAGGGPTPQYLPYPLAHPGSVRHPGQPAPVSALRMAACFNRPACFLPGGTQSSSSSTSRRRLDPRSSNGGSFMDSLFIVTWDMHLVQFDLSIGAADPSLSGDKIYQDSPVKLRCNPVGQWRLRPDNVFLPPFPTNHPLISLLRSPPKSSRLLSSSSSRNLLDISPLPEESASESQLDSSSMSAAVEVPISDTAGSVKQHIFSSSLPDIDLQQKHQITKQPRSITAAPEGWATDDAASYWYSQVELTTHLGPLRRIWMGPQFTFRIYPFSDEDVPSSDSFLYEPPVPTTGGRWSPLILQGGEFDSTGLCRPRCSSSICSCLSESMSEALESIDTDGGTSGCRLVDAADFDKTSVDKTKFARHPSAEESFFCPPPQLINPADGGFLGSSSPCGSFGSLASRGIDNVAHHLAEAMQEGDAAQMKGRRMDAPSGIPTIISPSLFFLRPHSPKQSSSIPPRSSANLLMCPAATAVLSSARDSLFLSESDFPSQDQKELEHESTSQGSVYVTTENELPFQEDESEILNRLDDLTIRQQPDNESTSEAVLLDPAMKRLIVEQDLGKAISLPLHIDHIFRDSGEDDFSSSPSKAVYSITEPGEMSTGSSGGRLLAGNSAGQNSGKKAKSSKARKRAQAKFEKANKEIQSETVQKQQLHQSHLLPARKHRSRLRETPERVPPTSPPQNDLSELSSEEEEMSERTKETVEKLTIHKIEKNDL